MNDFDSLWPTLQLGDRDAEPVTVTMRPQGQGRPRQDFSQSLESLPLLFVDDSTFKLRHKLGEGGSGQVLAAEQSALAREVAIKQLLPSVRDDPHKMGALLTEGWTTGRLEHPNIIPIYALGRDDNGAPALVMRRVEGVVWRDAIVDPRDFPRPWLGLDPLEAHLRVLMQVCQAIHYAHSCGIIHRDIKPDNVMLGAFGEVYVLDWGIAVCIDDDAALELPKARDQLEVAGTPCYMAPEMAIGKGAELGPHSDVYTLGAVLHELLTGYPPHGGGSLFEQLQHAYISDPPPLEAYGDAPEELAELCRVSMAREIGHRMQSAESFRQAVADFLSHRASSELVRRAEESLEQLERFSKHEDIANLPRDTIDSLFGGCQFGFASALEIWPANDEARQGARQAIVAMIRIEIAKERAEAARALLRRLEPPDRALLAEIEELESRLKARDDELDRLRELGRELDPGIGATQRAWAAAIFATIWFIIPLLRHGRDLDYTDLLWSTVVSNAMIVIPLFLFRRHLWSTLANRRMISALVVTLGLALLMRLVGWVGNVPLEMILWLPIGVYVMSLSMLAIYNERRVGLAAVFYALALVASAIKPEWVWIWTAVSNGAVFSWLGYVWWSLAREGR